MWTLLMRLMRGWRPIPLGPMRRISRKLYLVLFLIPPKSLNITIPLRSGKWATLVQEFETHQSIFRPEKGGYTPAFLYYLGVIHGYNDADNAQIVAPGNTTSLPIQLIGGTNDPIIIGSAQIAATLAFAPMQ